LRAGEQILLTGVMYTARDAAHKRFVELLERGEPLPFDIAGETIYYCGPSPARPGEIIGSAGPTTSSRMDAYAPRLLRLGLRGMIGKGARSNEVIDTMRETGGVYFAAIGGAGALLSRRIASCEVVAFPELGAEAVYKIGVVDFPVTVAIDARGENAYELGRREYLTHTE
jgi:fumarate hydratase subunit beta